MIVLYSVEELWMSFFGSKAMKLWLSLLVQKLRLSLLVQKFRLSFFGSKALVELFWFESFDWTFLVQKLCWAFLVQKFRLSLFSSKASIELFCFKSFVEYFLLLNLKVLNLLSCFFTSLSVLNIHQTILSSVFEIQWHQPCHDNSHDIWDAS